MSKPNIEMNNSIICSMSKVVNNGKDYIKMSLLSDLQFSIFEIDIMDDYNSNMMVIPISEESCVLAKDARNPRHINVKGSFRDRDSINFIHNELLKWMNELFEDYGKIRFCCDDDFNWNLFSNVILNHDHLSKNKELFYKSPLYLPTFLYTVGIDTDIDRGYLVDDYNEATTNNDFIDHLIKHIANYDKDMKIIRDSLWMSVRLAYIFGKIKVINIIEETAGTVTIKNSN